MVVELPEYGTSVRLNHAEPQRALAVVMFL
jgi:hypothetical protein